MARHLSSEQSGQGWQFVTNHTQVLLCIARDPETRLRDIADDVGITLGSAQRILADLVEAGYVTRERHGRRNRYVINRDTPMLRHSAQDGRNIGGLLNLLRLAHPD
jgi:DNA-binding MarR family transcriptional regulator